MTDSPEFQVGSWFRQFIRSPVLLILLIAPYFGEGLSGSSPPLTLLLPWNLAYMAALYGCGALLCREITHRFNLGFTGLVMLGVAYGVWEEALVDRFWFFPKFWEDSDIGTYSVFWHTNVLLATHLTVFHTAISISASVLVVEWLRPRSRHVAWTSRRGLIVAAVVLALTPVIYGEFDQRPPTPVLVAAAGLVILVVVAAFAVGRWPRTTRCAERQPRRWLGTLAFSCVLAHWILTYSVAETNIPWPAGVAISLAPVALGVVLVSQLAATGPYGGDGVRVIVGLLAFFVLLDLLVGFLGRYDMILSALITAYFVRRLYARRDSIGVEPAQAA